MTIQELKTHFESLPKDKELEFKLSRPFSWRGSYDEVAFSIAESKSYPEENLKMIEEALAEEFEGYKGGTYRYSLNTKVNFEEHYSDYTDGGYIGRFLVKALF